jgi:hypothetical protein
VPRRATPCHAVPRRAAADAHVKDTLGILYFSNISPKHSKFYSSKFFPNISG